MRHEARLEVVDAAQSPVYYLPERLKVSMNDEGRQKDYYSLLGARDTATREEIERLYKRLAQQHHPDRGGVCASSRAGLTVSPWRASRTPCRSGPGPSLTGA